MSGSLIVQASGLSTISLGRLGMSVDDGIICNQYWCRRDALLVAKCGDTSLIIQASGLSIISLGGL